MANATPSDQERLVTNVRMFTTPSIISLCRLGGEGFGAMIVKTLRQALLDGDTIRAVVQNSGANQ